MPEDCLICAKHRGDGPLAGPYQVWTGEHMLLWHRPTGDDGTAVLGYLFVESRRHVATFDALTRAEVESAAVTAWRAAQALRAEFDPEHVFSAIIGRGVAHFHQHVFARHRGTPREYPWTASDEWPDAPRGGPAEITDLCTRLRAPRPARPAVGIYLAIKYADFDIISRMARTTIDLDDDKLAAAARELGTTSKVDTVNAALEFVASRRRRAEAFDDPLIWGTADLVEPEIRAEARR